MYNASQLSNWCLKYIGHNYSEIFENYPKIMKSLSPDNQAILNLSRWPPNWYGKVKRKYQIYLFIFRYIKDYEIYERFVHSLATENERNSQNLKRRR